MHVNSLLRIKSRNQFLFLKFNQMYLNDLIFLLDENLTLLKRIKCIEVMDANQQTKEVLEECQGKLKQLEYFSGLMNIYFKQITFLSKASAEVFLSDEIRDKLVQSLLNYALFELNGADYDQKYKISSENTTKFDRFQIMRYVVEIFLNYQNNDLILKSIVTDERCFDLAVFKRAADIMEKKNVFVDDTVDKYRLLILKLEDLFHSQKDGGEDGASYDPNQLSNIPDEFTDPLTCRIMLDPVLVPTSNVVIDRINIVKCILSKEEDPFNRKKLSVGDLVPQPELKLKIQQFIEQNRPKAAKP